MSMGKVEKFYSTLESVTEIIFLEPDLRNATEHWRWYALGLWTGLEAWTHISHECLSVNVPIGWRENVGQ